MNLLQMKNPRKETFITCRHGSRGSLVSRLYFSVCVKCWRVETGNKHGSSGMAAMHKCFLGVVFITNPLQLNALPNSLLLL